MNQESVSSIKFLGIKSVPDHWDYNLILQNPRSFSECREFEVGGERKLFWTPTVNLVGEGKLLSLCAWMQDDEGKFYLLDLWEPKGRSLDYLPVLENWVDKYGIGRIILPKNIPSTARLPGIHPLKKYIQISEKIVSKKVEFREVECFTHQGLAVFDRFDKQGLLNLQYCEKTTALLERLDRFVEDKSNEFSDILVAGFVFSLSCSEIKPLPNDSFSTSKVIYGG